MKFFALLALGLPVTLGHPASGDGNALDPRAAQKFNQYASEDDWYSTLR